MAAKEGVDVLYLTMEHWPAAQAVFGAMAAAVAGQLPRSAACALVAAAARGSAQAHVGNDQDKRGASLHVMQEALGALHVNSVTEALRKIRGQGRTDMAKRLQRLSRAINVEAHPEVSLADDLRALLALPGGAATKANRRASHVAPRWHERR